MTDLEIVKACAEAMNYKVIEPTEYFPNITAVIDQQITAYRPLHDKAQAMELVIRFRLNITQGPPRPAEPTWHVEKNSLSGAWNADLLRAICVCVALLHRRRIRQHG